MITQKQLFDNEEWLLRINHILKLHKELDKEYWFKQYGRFIFEDIKKRREKNKNQTIEIRK